MKEIVIDKSPQSEKLMRYLKGNNSQIAGDGILINKFSELIKEIAQLSFFNKDYLLLFRGQTEDVKNIAKVKSTLYPSIYRERANKKGDTLNLKFRKLYKASRLLIKEIENKDIIGKEEIINKKYVQWAILQHYGVCDTPLLDLTHSLRVACSFALNENKNNFGYVYVLGVPHITNRISTNSEQDTVIVRLLSICPPQAFRPYYQEGYLAGTEFITEDYSVKQELDFNRRVIAKYKIKNNREFWDRNTQKIPNESLYPIGDDIFEEITRNIIKKLDITNDNNEELATEVGLFVLRFAEMERLYMQTKDTKNVFGREYKSAKKFRDTLLDKPNYISINDIRNQNDKIDLVIYKIRKN